MKLAVLVCLALGPACVGTLRGSEQEVPDASSPRDADVRTDSSVTLPDASSPDASTSSDGSPPDSSSPDAANLDAGPVGPSVLVAVGYGGLRIRSLDDGLTWRDGVALGDRGGDDHNLLRGAAWGAGRFVAVGWSFFASTDGSSWTPTQNPTSQWMGAVAFGNGQFLAAGGGGYCARSQDGMSWEECTDVTNDSAFTHVRSVLFHEGLFYTADALGVLRSSTNGDTWRVVNQAFGSPWAAVVNGAVVVLPEGEPFHGDGFSLRAQFPSSIQRQVGGGTWTTVAQGTGNNTVFQANRFAFAEGYPAR